MNAILTGSNDSGLSGNNLDNRLSGNSGTNGLDGRGGTDTAVFSAASTEYEISRSGETIVVVDTVAGREGTVTLESIEHLEFAETTLSADQVDA